MQSNSYLENHSPHQILLSLYARKSVRFLRVLRIRRLIKHPALSNQSQSQPNESNREVMLTPFIFLINLMARTLPAIDIGVIFREAHLEIWHEGIVYAHINIAENE